jgi:hypothetical protein
VFLPLNIEIHSDAAALVSFFESAGFVSVGFVVGVVPLSKPPNNMEVKNEAIIFLFFKE